MAHPLEMFRYCPCCGSEHFYDQNDRSKKCQQCGFQYYLNAVAAVAVFILSPEGNLLLCTRAHEPEKGKLDLPGGFVDLNETAEQAAIREIKEELNLTVSNIEYCFSVPNEYLYSDFTVRTLDLFFKANIQDLSEIKCADDVSQAAFFPPDKINIDQIGLKSIKKAVTLFLKDNRF